MTEAEWLACADPELMLEDIFPTRSGDAAPIELDGGRGGISDRRLRLYMAAISLLDVKSKEHQRAIDLLENIADDKITTEEAGRKRSKFKRDWTVAHAAINPPYQELHWLLTDPYFMDSKVRARIAGILRDVVGNPFRLILRVDDTTPAVDPSHHDTATKFTRRKHPRVLIWRLSWATETVRALAQGAYEDRDFARLPIIADALEEAGCTEAAILDHLRAKDRCPTCREWRDSTENLTKEVQAIKGASITSMTQCPDCTDGWVDATHVRGCHVLDLVLGKE